MLVADSVTSITVEQALNAYLTGVLWGHEGLDNSWQWKSTAPSLCAPEPVSHHHTKYCTAYSTHLVVH